jgi:hypothetical protein
MMVRPDAPADLLGVSGFFVCGGRSSITRRASLAGIALLVLAILTKQTAGIFLLAAALSLALEGAWRRALELLGGGLAALGLIVLVVNLLFEPHFAASLLGERIMPWSFSAWRILLDHILLVAPDLLYFAALGLILWIGRRPRDWPAAALTGMLLVSALVLSAKLGADTNYSLGLRISEAIAFGTLWQAVHATAGRSLSRTVGLALATVLGIATIYPGVVSGAGQEARSRAVASSFGKLSGQRLLFSYRSAIALARDPGVAMLTDSGLLDLYQGDRATFGDPWLFHTLVDLGKLHPTRIIERIDSQYYDVIITGHDLDSPRYLNEDFRLPNVLRAHALARYVVRDVQPGLFYYGRRGGEWPPSSFTRRQGPSE